VGASFRINQESGPLVLEVHTHHDVIPALRGARIGLELLNGITPQQAKKILDVLNENIVGVVFTTATSDK
jgi:hypothetical protein